MIFVIPVIDTINLSEVTKVGNLKESTARVNIMSNLLNVKPVNDCKNSPCSAIEQLIEPKEKNLGDFSVRRLFPAVGRKSVGPWVFFDHMGPAHFEAGNGINVRPHPHIGIATVTYIFKGEILHRDSLGSYQTIRPGDINLMIAGKGIVHSERERPEVSSTAHSLHALQLWLALPTDKEEMQPEFHHYPAEDIPCVADDNIWLRVMMGTAYGESSPVKTFAETLYVEADFASEQSLALPKTEELAIYVAKGSVTIDDTIVKEHSMAVINTKVDVSVLAQKNTRLAIIGGEHLGKRYIDWNFVSSSKERIEKAKEDWKAGVFPKVPGDEEEFIPLP